jgi:hypothetical protein
MRMIGFISSNNNLLPVSDAVKIGERHYYRRESSWRIARWRASSSEP